MESYNAFPKVYALGHSAIKELLFDEVLIEEKIDGSQFSFGRFNGEFKCRSKGAEIYPETPEAMFADGVFQAMALDLHDGWTYRAEYLKTPKHNVIAYDRIPEKHLVIFDINVGNEQYLDIPAKVDECARLGLECVPVMYVGKVNDHSEILGFLNKPPLLGGKQIEGIVIKNYSRFGMDKKVLMGKYVSEAFKEVHSGEWKAANPTRSDIITYLVQMYRTPARWEKAIQHLRDAGKLTNTPRDIGFLIKEVQNDIVEEEKEEIKNKLYAQAIDHIKRGVVGGLPEFYKEHLMKQQFS